MTMQARGYDTDVEVGEDVLETRKHDPKATKPFAIEYTDGYYSVRQAVDHDHARELSAERHPTRTIKRIRAL